MLSGFDGTSETQSASSAAAYWVLDDFKKRAAKGEDIDTLMQRAQAATADIKSARLMIVKPPVIRGIGSPGLERKSRFATTRRVRSTMTYLAGPS